MPKRLIVIVGATGSGKTELSLHLAKYFDAPIISTDSRQIYKGMSIGTAQPSVEQMQSAEHHFIAIHNIQEDFNCGEYETQALALLKQLFVKHDYVVAVGGSGLYVKALCEGMDAMPEVDIALRAALAEELRITGLQPLLKELEERDPVYYNIVDRCNPARILRAVEVCRQTGRPYSEQRKGARCKRDFSIVKIGVDLPREVLYERINYRVDEMISVGLEAEARSLYPFRELNALQTVGYRELFDYFDGSLSWEETVALIKRNTRHYAKRQLTWFGRDAEVVWFSPYQMEKMIKYITTAK